jgi:hypothetical protein
MATTGNHIAEWHCLSKNPGTTGQEQTWKSIPGMLPVGLPVDP